MAVPIPTLEDGDLSLAIHETDDETLVQKWLDLGDAAFGNKKKDIDFPDGSNPQESHTGN
jgi:hypothetical protein